MADPERRGVFISWSKSVSAEVARQIKPFLEDVLGSATIFMSQALEGGARWAMEIPRHLESCNAGLILVTRENRHEPWLHFEAGALSKHIVESRVVPLLCGSSVGDIQGTPLSMFQAKSLDHDEFLEVCVSFGAAFDVAEETVRRRFEKSWPDLEAAVVPLTKRASRAESELRLADLMAVLERLAAQVAAIEASVRPSGSLPAGMFGGRRNALIDANTLLALSGQQGAEWTVPTADLNVSNALLEIIRQQQAKSTAERTDAPDGADKKPTKK